MITSRLLILFASLALPLVGAEKSDIMINAAAEARFNDKRRLDAAVRDAEAAVARLLERVTIKATIQIIQVLPDGVLAQGNGYVGQPKAIPQKHSEWVQGTGLDAHKKVLRVWTDYTYDRDEIALGETFFVRMATAGLVDRSSLAVRMWRFGTHSYLNTAGARATVRRYTADFSDIRDRVEEVRQELLPRKQKPAPEPLAVAPVESDPLTRVGGLSKK